MVGSNGSSSDTDIWVAKSDTNGTIEWQQTYDVSNNNDAGIDIIQVQNESSYIVLGSSLRFGQLSTVLIKIDGNNSGAEVWRKQYGYGSGIGLSVLQSLDGFIVTGFKPTSNNPSNLNFWLLRTYANGSIAWEQSENPKESIQIACSIVETDDGYIIGGEDLSTNQILIVKTDVNGNRVWSQYFGYVGRSESFSLSNIVKINEEEFIVEVREKVILEGRKRKELVERKVNFLFSQIKSAKVVISYK